MDTKLLEKIKNELPTGAIKQIADEAKVSKGTVVNFFEGKTNNIKVLNAVSKIYSEYKKSLSQLTALAS